MGPEDLPKLRCLLHDPSLHQRAAYRERVAKVRRFAGEQGVLVLGWSAFGMDAITWLCGETERTVMAAMTEPSSSRNLVDVVYDFTATDRDDVGGWRSGCGAATRLAQLDRVPGRHLFPALPDAGHHALGGYDPPGGAIFAYVMTTGAMAMADQLLAAQCRFRPYVDPRRRKATALAAPSGTNSKGRLALARYQQRRNPTAALARR